MQTTQAVGEVIWGFMLFMWVAGTFIRWAFPTYSEKMLERTGK